MAGLKCNQQPKKCGCQINHLQRRTQRTNEQTPRQDTNIPKKAKKSIALISFPISPLFAKKNSKRESGRGNVFFLEKGLPHLDHLVRTPMKIQTQIQILNIFEVTAHPLNLEQSYIELSWSFAPLLAVCRGLNILFLKIYCKVS